MMIAIMAVYPVTAHSQHPDNTEVQARINKLQAQLQRQGLDIYLGNDPANIFYLTNKRLAD